MKTEVETTEAKEPKIQYILDEQGNLTEMLKDDAVPVEFPVKYKLQNAFEVFVRVKGSENYWISNYGRCINNLMHKDKMKFYEHKQGDVHYTIFEITRKEVPKRTKKGRKKEYKIVEERHRRESSPAKLVAETFLVSYKGRDKVWHKDGDKTNNWYKNLIYIPESKYLDLKKGKIKLEDLHLEQEYIEYENKANYEAYKIYNAIRVRCKNTRKEDEEVSECYREAYMCQEWVDNSKSFIRWYLDHFYTVGDESMAVDKDLFGNGSKIYSPETCCILPQGLNTLLTNSKKSYNVGESPENTLPFGVRYSGKRKKYYGEITFTGTGKAITLSEWDTPEEAFAEYKVMKQADILLVAAKYKESIPEYIYKALLTIEVKPY